MAGAGAGILGPLSVGKGVRGGLGRPPEKVGESVLSVPAGTSGGSSDSSAAARARMAMTGERAARTFIVCIQ